MLKPFKTQVLKEQLRENLLLHDKNIEFTPFWFVRSSNSFYTSRIMFFTRVMKHVLNSYPSSDNNGFANMFKNIIQAFV